MAERNEGTLTARILDLAKRGLTQKQIANEMNYNYRCVGNALFKLRQRGLLDSTSKDWSVEELEALRGAVEEKWLSGGQAASFLTKKFGRPFTRNMVIGKVKRLGLELRGGISAWRAAHDARKRESAGKRERKTKPQQVKRPAGKICAEKISATPMASARVVARRNEAWAPRRVTLLDLRPGDCRFPLGDPRSEDFAFCGAPAPIGEAYCPHCAGVSYERPAQRAATRKAWREARGLPAEGAMAPQGASA